jgi:RND family efflux transporter MFP subunit
MNRQSVLRLGGAALALGVLGVVMAFFAGAFSPSILPGTVAVEPEPIEGEVVAVESVRTNVEAKAPGTVEAQREAVLSPRITARITAVHVRAGDAVDEGTVLVELDERDLESRLRQMRDRAAAARARLDEAERHFQRIRDLYERDVVSRADLDRAEADRDAAQAELARARDAVDEARTALSHATIQAPMTGRVIDRLAEPGDTARPGVPLLRIYDPGSLQLDAHVRESIAARLERGQSLNARIDAIDMNLEVTINEIVPFAEAASRTFIVRAGLPRHANLYPGMFGRLIIVTGSQQRIEVPAAAIERVGQLEFVRVVTDQGPVRRHIRTGETTPDGRVEVMSGLVAGERIVIPR